MGQNVAWVWDCITFMNEIILNSCTKQINLLENYIFGDIYISVIIVLHSVLVI